MRKALAVAMAVLALPVSVHNQTRQERGKIAKDLESMYAVSKLSLFDQTTVNRPAGIYTILVDGIQGEVSIQSGVVSTYVVDGKLRATADSGAGKLLGSVLSGKTREEPRIMKKGERVYITGIDALSDGVAIDLMTVDTVPIIDQGRTRQVAYKARLLFTGAIRGGSSVGFPPVADAAEMKKIIDGFVVSEKEASAPKTIELGQTIQQVESILGLPASVAKLGAKTIYTYKDLKVVFTDGKVSDVQ